MGGVRVLGFEVIRFEDNFKIDPEKNSQEVCIDNVQEADFVILLLDCNFGSRFKFDESISITQAEYREGKKKNIPVFHFIKKSLEQEYFKMYNEAKKIVDCDSGMDLILENLKKLKPE